LGEEAKGEGKKSPAESEGAAEVCLVTKEPEDSNSQVEGNGRKTESQIELDLSPFEEPANAEPDRYLAQTRHAQYLQERPFFLASVVHENVVV